MIWRPNHPKTVSKEPDGAPYHEKFLLLKIASSDVFLTSAWEQTRTENSDHCSGPEFVLECPLNYTSTDPNSMGGAGTLCLAPAVCVGLRRFVSGPGALCGAPALHRAQFKTVYNMHVLWDSGSISRYQC